MRFVAVLPVVDPAYGRACVESMHPALQRATLVIDNSCAPAPFVPTDVRVGRYVRFNENIGVARAWNLGIERAVADDADYLVIISSSVRFGARGGKDVWDALHNDALPHGCGTQLGWRLVAVGRSCWETIGQFDPVFSPAYFEDTDYLYRLGLAGMPSPRENGGVWPQVMIDATVADEAHSIQAGFVHVDMRAQQQRYVDKWGGPQGEEKFTAPYDDATLDYTHIGGPRAQVP